MSSGFFTEAYGKRKRKEVSGSLPLCASCKLYKCSHCVKYPDSIQDSSIIVVSGIPSKEHIETHNPFSGKYDSVFNSVFKKAFKAPVNRFTKTFAVKCTPKTGKPSTKEVRACFPLLLNLIKQEKPQIVILLGSTAVSSYIGNKFTDDVDGIEKWRGTCIPDYDIGAWVCSLEHPVDVFDEEGRNLEAKQFIFKTDLKRIASLVGVSLPPKLDLEKSVEIADEKRAVEFMLDILERKPRIAFDYEASGLKPYRKGHSIFSCSIADSSSHSLAFMLTDKTKEKLSLVLKDKEIKKIAANFKYEMLWTWHFFNHGVKGFVFDTMLASHVLDNREGITGLKYQAFIRFGISDYNSHLKEYIETTPKEKKKHGSHGFNRLHLVPERDLLVYNAIDSLIEYNLASLQKRELI